MAAYLDDELKSSSKIPNAQESATASEKLQLRDLLQVMQHQPLEVSMADQDRFVDTHSQLGKLDMPTPSPMSIAMPAVSSHQGSCAQIILEEPSSVIQ